MSYIHKPLGVRVTVPPLQRRVLSRDRLLSIMVKCLDYKLTIISANTGFGKTSLLSSFAHFIGLSNTLTATPSVAWYSLDAGDVDFGVFCSYLIAAIRSVYPFFGESFEKLLDEALPQINQDANITNRLAEEFVLSLESLPAQATEQIQTETSFRSLIIILDDYQFVEEVALINRFIGRILIYLPPMVHFVIASRVTPSNLPIPQLFAKQDVLVFNSEDLAFTQDEIAALVKKSYTDAQTGDALITQNEIEVLSSDTGGWAVALVLMLNNVQHQHSSHITSSTNSKVRLSNPSNIEDQNVAPIDSVDNSTNKGGRSVNLSTVKGFEHFFNYLVHEVFNNQPEYVQNFLIRTCVLNFLTPTLCTRLLTVTADDSFCNKKIDANASDADASNVIRDKTELALITNTASANLSSQELLLEIENRNLFIVRRNTSNTQLGYSRQPQFLWQYHALFKQFLTSKLKQNTFLCRALHLEAAHIAKENGDYNEAIIHFVEAGEQVQAALVLDKVAVEIYQNGGANALTSLLNLISSDGEDPIKNMPELLCIRGRIFHEKGDNEKALHLYFKAIEIFREQDQIDAEVYYRAVVAQILSRCGRSEEAIQNCMMVLNNKIEVGKSSKGLQAISMVYYILGLVATDYFKIKEAKYYFDHSLIMAEQLHNNYLISIIYSGFGQLYHNVGYVDKANFYYEKVITYFTKIGFLNRVLYQKISKAINDYSQCYYQLAESQLDELVALIKRGELNDDYIRLYVLLYQANIYRETSRYNLAEKTYIEALDLARQTQVRKVEFLVLNEMTTNLMIQNRLDEALSKVQQGLELVEEYNLTHRKAYQYRTDGWVHFLAGQDYVRVIMAFDRAIALFQSSTNLLEQARTSLALALVYFKCAGESIHDKSELKLDKPIANLDTKNLKNAVTNLIESLAICERIGYQPFLTFEVAWALPLFEYVITYPMVLIEILIDTLLTKIQALSTKRVSQTKANITTQTNLTMTVISSQVVSTAQQTNLYLNTSNSNSAGDYVINILTRAKNLSYVEAKTLLLETVRELHTQTPMVFNYAKEAVLREDANSRLNPQDWLQASPNHQTDDLWFGVGEEEEVEITTVFTHYIWGVLGDGLIPKLYDRAKALSTSYPPIVQPIRQPVVSTISSGNNERSALTLKRSDELQSPEASILPNQSVDQSQAINEIIEIRGFGKGRVSRKPVISMSNSNTLTSFNRKIAANDVGSRKALQIIFYLLEANMPVEEDILQAAVWPNKRLPGGGMGRSFYTTISIARNLLGGAAKIKNEKSSYSLDFEPKQLWYDVNRFEKLIEEARKILSIKSNLANSVLKVPDADPDNKADLSHKVIKLLEEAVEIVRHSGGSEDFLINTYSEWPQGRRIELYQKKLEVYELLAQAYVEVAQKEQALIVLSWWVAADSENEEALRRYVKLLAEIEGRTKARNFLLRKKLLDNMENEAQELLQVLKSSRNPIKPFITI